MIRPKQVAHLGEFHLKEAVLDILCEEFEEGTDMNPAKISHRAGTYCVRGVAI